jgi:hypothetical protein
MAERLSNGLWKITRELQSGEIVRVGYDHVVADTLETGKQLGLWQSRLLGSLMLNRRGAAAEDAATLHIVDAKHESRVGRSGVIVVTDDFSPFTAGRLAHMRPDGIITIGRDDDYWRGHLSDAVALQHVRLEQGFEDLTVRNEAPEDYTTALMYARPEAA